MASFLSKLTCYVRILFAWINRRKIGTDTMAFELADGGNRDARSGQDSNWNNIL